MNLLIRLLRYAKGERAQEEDPITEILAHLLRVDADFCSLFLAQVDRVAPGSGVAWSKLGQPEIDTQVSVPEVAGRRGVCRYDLLLRWPPSHTQLVVEVKVGAGLTFKAVERGDAVVLEDQLRRYLDIATTHDRAYVCALGISAAEVPPPALGHARFVGCVPWQGVHDAASARRVRDREVRPHDILIDDFIGLLENFKMATPKLTMDGLASVYPYNAFYRSFEAIIGAAEQGLRAKGLLQRFDRATAKRWQEEYQRMGYRLFVSGEASRFAFMGLWHGPDPIHEGVPDLYCFLEVARESPAAQIIDQSENEIVSAIAELNRGDGPTKWSYAPGGYETIRCRMSMVELIRSPDPAAAAEAFFTDCFDALERHQLLALYFRAVSGEPSATPSAQP